MYLHDKVDIHEPAEIAQLLYETTRFVEIYKQYGHIAQERSLEPEERQEMKFYNRLADGFTPLDTGQRCPMEKGRKQYTYLPLRCGV